MATPAMLPAPRHWYTYESASVYLGLTERQVRRATAAGKIAHTKLGGLRVYFSQEQLDEYIAACTVPPVR